ncbi:MAG: carbohydrate kinase [Actinobacteria bacterium]|nr:MAG: carbohydrate kinase [Actinomycetota bacterium]
MDLTTDPHILAIGEALIDIVTPISYPANSQEIPGGSPANVAMTLGRLGRNVALQTWIGNDSRGRMIMEHFGASNVLITEESYGAQHTTTANALINDAGSASYTFDMEWAPSAPIHVSPQARIVHAGSISAFVEPGATVVLDALVAARRHALVTYDPNARPAIMGNPKLALDKVSLFVAVSDVVKVSDEDIAWLTGGRNMEDVIVEWLNMGPQIVIVTRGKEGALAVTSSGVRCESEPGDVAVVDTVGAGDSFMGGILDAMWEYGLVGAESRHKLRTLDEGTVKAILTRADAISDITVSRAGANPPWREELGAR